MIEGRLKEEVCIFSKAEQSLQEVHVSESGSAETAQKKRDKKLRRAKSDALFLGRHRLKGFMFDLIVTFHVKRKII